MRWLLRGWIGGASLGALCAALLHILFSGLPDAAWEIFPFIFITCFAALVGSGVGSVVGLVVGGVLALRTGMASRENDH